MLWQKVIGATSGGSVIQYVGGRVSAYLGTTSDITVGLTGLTGGIATRPAEGDLVIVYFATAGISNSDLVVSGYTEVVELYSNDSYDTNFVIARKLMGATPDTTVTLTGGTLNATNAGTVAVQVWRNVSATTPFDVAGLSSVKEGAEATFPSITPISNGAVILAGSAAGYSATLTQTYSNSSLTGFISIAADDTYKSTIGVGYHYWTSGSFTPANSVFGGPDNSQFSSASYIMALRPAL